MIIKQRLRCLVGLHDWRVCGDNLHGTASEKTITIAWRECHACGQSRLLFIYGNGHAS